MRHRAGQHENANPACNAYSPLWRNPLDLDAICNTGLRTCRAMAFNHRLDAFGRVPFSSVNDAFSPGNRFSADEVTMPNRLLIHTDSGGPQSPVDCKALQVDYNYDTLRTVYKEGPGCNFKVRSMPLGLERY